MKQQVSRSSKISSFFISFLKIILEISVMMIAVKSEKLISKMQNNEYNLLSFFYSIYDQMKKMNSRMNQKSCWMKNLTMKRFSSSFYHYYLACYWNVSHSISIYFYCCLSFFCSQTNSSFSENQREISIDVFYWCCCFLTN